MGGAGQVAPAGHPVEQAHDPLDDGHVGPVRPWRNSGATSSSPTSQGSRLRPGTPQAAAW